MAQIWNDTADAMNNVVMSNNEDPLYFKWAFVTFSNEEQEAAEVRLRKMGIDNIILGDVNRIPHFMKKQDAMWNTWSEIMPIGRFEDTNTWVLSGGQLVPPAAANRKYTNITHVIFPRQKFSPGMYSIEVRQKTVGVAEWSDWTHHKIEVNDWDDRAYFLSSSSAQVKGPAFPSEGVYGVRVEVMSTSGAVATSGEQQFSVWSTDKYLNDGGNVRAVPEHYHNGQQPGRVKR